MDVLLSSVPVFLFGTGIFYIFKLRGFYLLHPVKALRSVFRRTQASGVSPVKALCMALAGTLGVGNIVGVATALYLGGSGAVFWMIFSALVAMVLKYAEITLAMRHRRYGSSGLPEGGAPYYIKDGLSRIGHPRTGALLGGIFAVLCLVNTFTMGSMLQANAVAGALEGGFHLPLWVTGVAVALLTVTATRGGVSRIASLTEKIVPFMTAVFLVLCCAVLFLRHDRIGSAVADIFSEAFDLSGVGGGILGFITSSGIKYGVMRGLVSNEAGCGTAPMAHASADTSSPARQGVLGLVEVFVDTVLLCSVTALAILVSDSGPNAFGADGVRTAQAAFSSVLGPWAGVIFAISVFCFGVATILCWAHYGMTSLSAVLRSNSTLLSKGQKLFPLIYGATVIIGALTAPSGVWALADGALAVMTLINLGVLLCMHREVVEETDLFLMEQGIGKPRK
ncbi:MAG: alanine:cation symporter family protein [Ruminococcaceae bacterium]|nr:alanine:cation symporter family protein [Oscillospiraceae bacterium]